MTNDELIAIIEGEETDSIGYDSGLLSDQRRKAMDFYLAKPYGNEIEGRSQVVTSEVMDAVEGMLPSLMSIFTSSDEIVRFEPNGPEDEAQAQQATDYLNYVFSRVNNGFVALHCAVKDALLQKNGFLKVYWENYTESGKESYEGLTEDELALLVSDPELEIIQHSEKDGFHDAVFRKKKNYGKICIDPIPPEEVLVSRQCPNDLKKARFVEHRSKKTISQLREMGFDVEDDLSDSETADFNRERIARLEYDDQSVGIRKDSDGSDPSTKEVWVNEAYIYVDFDEDGVAELRKVTKVGKEILKYKSDGKTKVANEELDSLPIVCGTPILMPHKLYGLSVADQIMDLQLVKSTVTRNLIDNFYFLNNGRYEVLDGMVNLDDMLTSRPGGVVRSKVLGAVKRLDTPALGMPAYQLLEYLDTVKESRVGKRTFAPGPDANILSGTATGAEIYKTWDSERTLLIARVLAETLVKDLFWKILELSAKHQTKPQVVKLRNQWVTVDPREWKNKFNLTVTVGLGTGSQREQTQGAMGILNIQGMMMKMGLMNQTLTPGNIYSAARLYVRAVDPKNLDAYFTNPQTMPPPQPQADPKIQLAAQKMVVGDKQKRDKMQLDAMMEERQREHEKVLAGAEMQHESMESSTDRVVDLKKHRDQLTADAVKKMIDTSLAQREQAGAERQADFERRLQVKEQSERPVVVNTTHDFAVVADGLNKVAEAQGQAAEVSKQLVDSIQEITKPKKKHVVVNRDAKGNIVSAEVTESS